MHNNGEIEIQGYLLTQDLGIKAEWQSHLDPVVNVPHVRREVQSTGIASDHVTLVDFLAHELEMIQCIEDYNLVVHGLACQPLLCTPQVTCLATLSHYEMTTLQLNVMPTLSHYVQLLDSILYSYVTAKSE